MAQPHQVQQKTHGQVDQHGPQLTPGPKAPVCRHMHPPKPKPSPRWIGYQHEIGSLPKDVRGAMPIEEQPAMVAASLI